MLRQISSLIIVLKSGWELLTLYRQSSSSRLIHLFLRCAHLQHGILQGVVVNSLGLDW